MATREQLYTALRNADAAGDTAAAQKLAAYIQSMPQDAATPPAQAALAEQPSFGQMLKTEIADSLPGRAVRAIPDLVAGGIRGAGSIGATLMAPVDAISDAMDGKGLSLESNRERRSSMTDALRLAGADTDSLAFGAGKLGGEIAGTAGMGGVAGNALARIPGAANAMPGVINALRTGGMTTGQAVAQGVRGVARDLGTRALGGAVTGGAAAGLVDPEQAGVGAAVGGALPIALRGAGAVGNAIGRTIRGPDVAPNVLQGAQAANSAGLVIPPTQVKPSLANRLLEGFSGKITTAQNASAKNQPILNDMVATELGLPAGQQVTPQALKAVRAQAGQAYDAVASTGTITPGPAYEAALDKIAEPAVKAAQGFQNAKASPVIDLVDSLRSPQFDASSAVAKLKELRTAADDAFRTGNTDVARASKAAANALEDALEGHLSKGVPTKSGVFGKDVPPPAEGMVRLYRGESPTTGFHDVFKADGLRHFSRPDGMVGKRYTDEIKVANYYKSSYGKDAVLKYLDVPAEQLGQYKVGTAEFIVDPQQVRLPGGHRLLKEFLDARQLIAKTYSAEKAMNPTSGNFDARKLAAQLDKGKPLSGGIRAVAEFGQQFPKAAQTVERMGSLPQTSPLDWAVGGSLSAATANPLAMAGVLARPAARALTLSPVIQNRLAQQSAPNALAGILTNEQLQQLGYQAAPVFAASGR